MKRIALFLIFLLFSVSVWGQEHDHHKTASEGNSLEVKKFMQEMNTGMEKMMKDMHVPGYTGNPDVDFLAMMIPHHEGAIEMARLVLIYGKDPLVRKFAEDIIAAQQAEIESMKRRLEILRKRTDIDPEGFPALGGTRGTSGKDKSSGKVNKNGD